MIGEARVLIRPDTTRFRAELETAVTRATRGVIVPVQVQAQATGSVAGAAAAQEQLAVSTTTASEAQARENALLTRGAVLLDADAVAAERDAAAQQELGIAKQRTTVSTRNLERAQSAGTTASTRLAASYEAVATAASAVGAAQVQATRASRAVGAAEVAVADALRVSNIALIDAASNTLTLARAREAETVAALQAARAEAAHAASLGNVQKAGIAGAAGLLGLRGAVLTAGAGFIAATAGIQAFAQAVGSAARLEQELNVFRVTAGATAEEMRRVAEQAEALGADLTLPAVSAGEAAEAMSLLARAGLSVQDAIDGARGTLQLATAAQVDNATATTLVASALNAFALNGEEAVRVADLLTGAANESQGEITDMGLALQQAAAVARLAGLNVQETVTLITELAQAGLRGSDAGTSLRTALIRLINPTAQAADALAELNVQIRDADGNVRPEVFADLTVALQDMSKAQQDATLALIFGQDALRAAAILGREGAEGFRETSEAISETGLAAEVASARMAGFSGDVEALRNSLGALGLQIGQLTIGPLSIFVRQVTEGVATLNEIIDVARDAGGEVRDFGQDLASIVPGAERATDALGKVGPVVARFFTIGPTLTAASLAMDLFGKESEESAGQLDTFGAAAERVTGVLGQLQGALERGARRITAQGPAEGLGVQQILNRVQGFDSAEVRARIAKDNEELLSVLRDEQAFLQSQLERDFVRRRPGLQRQLEQALLGVTNDIAAINQSAASAKKKAVSDLASAQRDADNALIQQLALGRERQQNAIAQAAQTQGVEDDIRTQQAFLKLLDRQIAIIRDQTQKTQQQRAAILALISAKIATNAAIKQLEEQQEQERQDTIDQIQNLNIQIAQEKGNEALEEKRIRQRLTRLNNLIQGGKKEGVELKKLILERERLRNQLKELGEGEDEDRKDARKSAAQFFFEQLQAQQGFTANLLGNLIRGPTAGLVGVPSPALPPIPDLGAALGAQTGAALGRQGGQPTAGQQNTVISLLERILMTLKQGNRADATPEAKSQRRDTSGVGDGVGGGGTAAVM